MIVGTLECLDHLSQMMELLLANGKCFPNTWSSSWTNRFQKYEPPKTAQNRDVWRWENEEDWRFLSPECHDVTKSWSSEWFMRSILVIQDWKRVLLNECMENTRWLVKKSNHHCLGKGYPWFSSRVVQNSVESLNHGNFNKEPRPELEDDTKQIRIDSTE